MTGSREGVAGGGAGGRDRAGRSPPPGFGWGWAFDALTHERIPEPAELFGDSWLAMRHSV